MSCSPGEGSSWPSWGTGRSASILPPFLLSRILSRSGLVNPVARADTSHSLTHVGNTARLFHKLGGKSGRSRQSITVPAHLPAPSKPKAVTLVVSQIQVPFFFTVEKDEIERI